MCVTRRPQDNPDFAGIARAVGLFGVRMGRQSNGHLIACLCLTRTKLTEVAARRDIAAVMLDTRARHRRRRVR
jgi:hypothetical protein